MKKQLYSLVAFFMVFFCQAQVSIAQAEYFWDTDPGVGNATAILATDGNFNNAFEQFSKTGITAPSAGLHKFCIRLKDNTGQWGSVFVNIINVQQASTSTILSISQAEYFWDTDPGQGSGTALLAFDGNFDSAFDKFLNTGIAVPATAGLHIFNVRIKDNSGVWSPTFKNVVSVQSSSPAVTCFENLTASGYHSLGIKADGTLWAWGYNSGGQLGLGVAEINVAKQVGTDTNWKSISTGNSHTLAIKTDGTLWAWGNNNYGEIGDGSTSLRWSPVQLGNATNWKSVATGSGFSTALKTDGTLWAWGSNASGQLGDGTTVNKNVPTQIGSITSWRSINVGESHTIATRNDGTLWAWGNNSFAGQLGDGTTVNKLVPTQIGNATNWKTVVVGGYHTMAQKTDGTLWAWGRNAEGQLGDGTNTQRTVPTQIGTATDWKSIHTGQAHTIAIKTEGSLYIWGNNNYGQLGNGTIVNRNVPTRLGTATNWLSAAGGINHTIAISTNGSLFTWGRNNNGQLGDATNTTSYTPLTIACPITVLGVGNFEAPNALKIYPNPVNDILTISFDKEITAVSVYNLVGQEVIAKTINASEGKIDVSNLSAGTYLVKVYAANQAKTLKIIKR